MSTTTQPPKPKRRWYQFSLKTLLIVVTVATVAFGGWVQYMRYRALENRAWWAAHEKRVRAANAERVHLNQTICMAYWEKPRPFRFQTGLDKLFDEPVAPPDPVTAYYVSNLPPAPLRHLPLDPPWSRPPPSPVLPMRGTVSPPPSVTPAMRLPGDLRRRYYGGIIPETLRKSL